MSSDRLLPSSTLVVGIVAGLAVAVALTLWGPEWHGGIVLLVVAGAVVIATVLASRIFGGGGDADAQGRT